MLSRKALRILHVSYAHSVIFCGIIVWGNTPNGIKIFRILKKKIIFLGKCINVGNCLKNGEFMFLLSLYIYTFIVCAEHKTFIYKERQVHNHDARSANNFHLSLLFEQILHTGIKILIIFPHT